jgi:hypothetical protein
MNVSNKFFIYPLKNQVFSPIIEISAMLRRRYLAIKKQKAQ